MAMTKGFTIERAGLISNEMFYTSLINDLCRNGAFTPVFTNTANEITSKTLKATLEFTGDILHGTQPWRISIDGSVADATVRGTGGQLVVGTKIQLPDDGTCFAADGTPVDSEINTNIAGKLGVTKSVVSGFTPLPDMFSLDMRITGGVLNMGGRIVYIRDNDGNLIHTYDPNVTTYFGLDADGNLVYDQDATALALILLVIYTNADGVYNVESTNINWQSMSLVDPDQINAATPFSYRLVVTSRGICLETWQNANFAERYYSWFCIQRLVDPISGAPLSTGHSPVVATYSFSNNNRPYLYEMITSSILKIIVREHDVLCPSKPTIVSNNSDYVNAMFNPMKQVATSESNQYYIIFPSGMNTHRHLYNEEMDLIAYTSAGVISQWNEASVNVYGEASVDVKDIPAGITIAPGDKITSLEITADFPAGILSCAHVKTVTVDPIDTTKAKLGLYEHNGVFKADGELKRGTELVGKASANSTLVNRLYKGGSANYGTAEGMRIMFMINGSGIDEDFGIVVGITSIPMEPINVVVTQAETSNDVTVTWDTDPTSEPVTSFSVYRSKVATFKPSDVTLAADKQENIAVVSGVSGGEVVFTGQTTSEVYYFAVVAVGSDGKSAGTVSSEIAIVDRTTPLNVTSTPGFWENVLNWTPVAGATKYSVYWSVAEDGVDPTVTPPVTGVVNDIAAPPFHHGSSVVGDPANLKIAPFTYTYQVTAFAPTESVKSVDVIGVTTDPTVINNMSVTALEEGFVHDLMWDAVPSAISYNVYWANSPIAATGLANKIEVTGANVYKHSALLASSTYYYKIEAVFAGGIPGTLSTEKSSTPIDPKQPQNVQVLESGSVATISWDHVVGATTYTVYYDTASTVVVGVSSSQTTTPPSRSIVFTRPIADPAGTTYNFVVTAKTGATVESIASAQVSVQLN